MGGNIEVDGPLTGNTKADLGSCLLMEASGQDGQGSPKVCDSSVFKDQRDAVSECARSWEQPEKRLEQEAGAWVHTV